MLSEQTVHPALNYLLIIITGCTGDLKKAIKEKLFIFTKFFYYFILQKQAFGVEIKLRLFILNNSSKIKFIEVTPF